VRHASLPVPIYLGFAVASRARTRRKVRTRRYRSRLTVGRARGKLFGERVLAFDLRPPLPSRGARGGVGEKILEVMNVGRHPVAMSLGDSGRRPEVRR
jgi:hypothetical protein